MEDVESARNGDADEERSNEVKNSRRKRWVRE